MGKSEEKQLVTVPILRKKQEIKEIPLEAFDIPISQLLKTYKNREIPRRWEI